MREIIFRGQTRRKGERVRMNGEPVEGNWVYGGVFMGTGDHSIIYAYDPINKFPVYSDTIGQYTGLHDATKWESLTEKEQQDFLRNHKKEDWNGKRIFEGDIVRCGTGRICKVTFFISPGVSGFDLVPIGGFNAPPPHNWSLFADTEVIGNIHDNPELIGI